tara:strand:- start:33 stop:863 length:831 start_codon:yes stop_codon:yes gene_type:complete
MKHSEIKKVVSDNSCVFCGHIVNEDLRKWFGKGGAGGAGGGGWDRYSSTGKRLGKCGDGKEGGAYAACLSKSKARKLGKKGIASFVKRKRAAQKKGGDPKKGGERKKGQKTIKVKTKAENMIRLKDLLKEHTVSMGKVYSNPYANSFKSIKQIQEQEEPEHFGGGENIDILGFETKHFDICRSAVILYNKLKESDLNDDGKELVISSAKELDHLFEMEKQVVKGEEVDHDPIEHSVELVNIISFQLGRVAEIINDDFERDTNFIKLHVMEIINRSK